MSDYLKGKRVIDPILISIARGYRNAAFIGERIFSVASTDKEGVRVPTFERTAFVEYDIEHAVGTDSNVLVHKKTGTLGSVLGEHDLATPVDYHERAESMFSEESRTICRATNGVNLRRELITARLAQDEKAYHTGYVKKLTASDRWADDKGDPTGVIGVGMEAIRAATGLCPSLMIMGVGMTALLRFHPTVQAAIGVSERKRITTEILQDLFQIEEIVIDTPASLPSTKAAMDKNSVPADVWGDDLMLHYVGKSQPGVDSTDENELSLGCTLRRKGIPVADKYDGAGDKVKYCRYIDTYKVTVVGGSVGYLITGISK